MRQALQIRVFTSRADEGAQQIIGKRKDHMNKNNQNTPPKVNKALYVVTVALLFVVAVIIAVMGSAGKKAEGKQNSDTLAPSVTTDMPAPETTFAPDTYRPETDSALPGTQNTPETDKKSANEDKSPASRPAPTLILPANGILTKSHSMDIQVYSQTMGDYRVHCGIDISTALGESVVAAADGVVSEIKNDPLYGVSVAVSHNGNMTTYYKNLDEDLPESIKVGYEIDCGEIIGVVGDSAMVEVAEEPHLHFEVYVDGKSVDPTEHFGEAAPVSPSAAEIYES